MKWPRLNSFFALIFLMASALNLFAGMKSSPKPEDLVQEKVISDFEVLAPGQTFHVGLTLKIKPRWHVYWSNPGESGIPTTVLLTSSTPGVTFGPVFYPIPKRFIFGGIISFGYADEVLLVSEASIPPSVRPGDRIDIQARSEWLVCEDICIPGGGSHQLTLPVGKTARANPKSGEAIQWSLSQRPEPLSAAPRLVKTKNRFDLEIALPPLSSVAPSTVTGATFFPETDKSGPTNPELRVLEENQQPVVYMQLPRQEGQEIQRISGILRLDSQVKGGKSITRAYQIDTAVEFDKAAVPTVRSEQVFSMTRLRNIFLYLALSMVGGLILNVMPCVLPVISLKILGFVSHAKDSRTETLRLGLWFAAGIFVSLWILALTTVILQTAGAQIGWGFQFQSPTYVLAMCILCVVIALNLLGAYEINLNPSGGALGLTQRGGRSGAFFNGILAVVLATPCTAPFMGAALGFAFSQSGAVIFLIFTGIAVGLSLPYVLLSAFPQWLKMLPRPGMWMLTFKQFLAFPMFATAIWLLWVFAGQQGHDLASLALTFLLILSLGLWTYGKLQATRPRLAVAGLLLIVLWGSYQFGRPALGESSVVDEIRGDTGGDNENPWRWQTWSEEAVEEAVRAGHPVFVDFTADWCLSCKVNEKFVLNTPEVKKAFQDAGFVLFKGDWTSKDEAIARILKKYGRSGVPLYIVFAPYKTNDPVVLPEVLTTRIVIDAIGNASKK
ncbi:MAG: thioredoxin family protein [Verrucomicrobiae bacterium]|nr:thioredoxin family protein [Verrucomicrobiae bacterium]